MASVSDWIEGARLRTLPAAAAPVIVGSAAAHYLGGFSAARAALALLVAAAGVGVWLAVNARQVPRDLLDSSLVAAA